VAKYVQSAGKQATAFLVVESIDEVARVVVIGKPISTHFTELLDIQTPHRHKH